MNAIKYKISEIFFSFNNFHLEAMRFALVGVINTAVDVLVYYFLTRYTDFFSSHIIATRVISFLSGSITSFMLNRQWTFKKKNRIRAKEVAKFYTTISISLVIGLLSMDLLIKFLHLYDLVALAFSVIFTFIWNFSFSRSWVFNRN